MLHGLHLRYLIIHSLNSNQMSDDQKDPMTQRNQIGRQNQRRPINKGGIGKKSDVSNEFLSIEEINEQEQHKASWGSYLRAIVFKK